MIGLRTCRCRRCVGGRDLASAVTGNTAMAVCGRRIDGQGQGGSMSGLRGRARSCDGGSGRQLVGRVRYCALPRDLFMSSVGVVVGRGLRAVVGCVLEGDDAFNFFAGKDAALLPLHVRAHLGDCRHASCCSMPCVCSILVDRSTLPIECPHLNSVFLPKPHLYPCTFFSLQEQRIELDKLPLALHMRTI